MVVKDPQAYWLFLLVVSIPFDITKWLSIGWVDSQALIDMYGMPMSDTIGLEVYLTDVVLLAMLLPWLARVCLRRTTAVFPKSCLPIFFLSCWALLISLADAPSFNIVNIRIVPRMRLFLVFRIFDQQRVNSAAVRGVIYAILSG